MGYIDNWKEEYRDWGGTDITNNKNLHYFSPLGRGNGTRVNPYNLTKMSESGTDYEGRYRVLPSGRYKLKQLYMGTCIGAGMNQTFIEQDCLGWNNHSQFIALTVVGWKGMGQGLPHFHGCKLETSINGTGEITVRNSLICKNITNNLKIHTTGNQSSNSFGNTIMGLSEVTNVNLFRRNSLFDNCTIEITQKDIDDYKGIVLGFNNCKFKIGSELEAKPLDDCSTEEDYRKKFLERCETAEIQITEEGLVNWGFGNNSTHGGVVLSGTVLDDFQKRKGSIGYKRADVKPIPLFFDQTMPNSLEKSTADNFRTDLVETDVKGKIKLKNTFPLKTRETLQVSSKVINLHGEKRLTDINVLDNIITGYGMNISADHSLDETAVVIDPKTETVGSGTLEIGYKYVVRDTKKGIASFTYNGSNYNTNLGGSNIVPIVADPNDSTKPLAIFTNIVGEPELYKVRSYELYQTMEMRIVDELPNVYVTSNKQLDKDFWYIVERTAEGEAYVTVDGKNYPVDCSFLVKGDVVGNVTAFKNARLRRCFTESYEYDSDDFYKGQQQPVWFKVVGNDMRCLRKNNSIYDVEMDTDTIDGKIIYVASGHPRFYNRLLDANGFRDRAFPIKGKYVQFRLHVSSFNIM